MKLGVRAKLFVVSMVLMAVVGLASAVFLENALRGWLMARIESDLLNSARATEAVIVTALSAGRPPSLEVMDSLAGRMGNATASRVTILDADGTVLGDSDLRVDQVRQVENHAQRPEIRQALREGAGISQRYSTTIDEQMMYVALPWKADDVAGVLRVSVPLSEVDESIETLRWIIFVAALVGLALAVFMSGLASHLLTRVLQRLVDYVRGISLGESNPRPPLGRDDELVSGLTGPMHRLSDELSQTVDALARERDRFEAVLENMSEAVVAVDADRRITLVNRAAVELLELKADPVGRPVLEVLRAPGLQALLDAADRGERASEEFDVNLSTTKRVLAQSSPQQDTPRQESSGTVVVMHDVTELRRLETMRRDFVANVSHELRTPVSVIRATAETLQDGAIDQPKHAARFLDALIRNSERLGRLISDLLDISRIEAGEYSIEARPIMLAQAATRAVQAVSADADNRGISLEIDLPSDLCARADANALDQVLTNLVQNAVKYTFEHGHICVRGRRRDGQVLVEVVDDGPGIPENHRDRLFERFYRVDSGRSRDVGGTGLGLSIVKHLVTTMGGRVGYEPAEPRGSIFWFSLPSC